MADPNIVYLNQGEEGKCGITKKIIHAGKAELPGFEDGTRVTFHYQSRKTDSEHTVIDDSKKGGGTPMELIIGKKFKFEVWETCLKTMRREEVSSFTVVPSLSATYPLISKSLREIRSGHSHAGHHCCGMALQDQGLGYQDLNELMKNPEELEFILEVLKVEPPDEFKKETWCMDQEEKLEQVPKLQDEGNRLYINKSYADAAEKYSIALGLLEQLILREKPHDEEWEVLDQKKTPLLLNLAQCRLVQKDYYAAIEHTTEVLKKDSDNVKALYRRAKAHVGAWDPVEARIDFQRAAELDPSLEKSVNKELQRIDSMQKSKDEEDKNKLKGLFAS